MAATKTEPTVHRGRHLLFAVIGLVHGPLTQDTGAAVLWLTGARSWSAELVALDAMAQLGFAALVAWLALFVFHAYIYRYGLTGIWFIGGYFLGVAFVRTRSLAVPVLLHAIHNILFFATVWYFNQ